MISTFLPSDFCDGPVGLIAGKGNYPILSAACIREANIPLRIVSFKGETEQSLISSVDSANHRQVKVGQLGKMLNALSEMNCKYALMAGQITPNRLFHGLHPDLKALKILNSLKVKNAETIFGAIAEEIRGIGVYLLDARSFIDDHLATTGVMTQGKLTAAQEYIDHGVKIAKAVSDHDIGQGCVVRKGSVLAVEAYEGTDPMLQRAGTFKTDGMIFVKTVKRKQDYRFDVPVFGDRTLQMMHESKIKTAALESGCVIMLDKEALLERARKLKIEIVGF